MTKVNEALELLKKEFEKEKGELAGIVTDTYKKLQEGDDPVKIFMPASLAKASKMGHIQSLVNALQFDIEKPNG